MGAAHLRPSSECSRAAHVFFYVGVSTFVIDLPMWLAQGFMPRPGSYLGGLVFAAAIVHFGRKWRAQAQDNSKGQ